MALQNLWSFSKFVQTLKFTVFHVHIHYPTDIRILEYKYIWPKYLKIILWYNSIKRLPKTKAVYSSSVSSNNIIHPCLFYWSQSYNGEVYRLSISSQGGLGRLRLWTLDVIRALFYLECVDHWRLCCFLCQHFALLHAAGLMQLTQLLW